MKEMSQNKITHFVHLISIFINFKIILHKSTMLPCITPRLRTDKKERFMSLLIKQVKLVQLCMDVLYVLTIL